ncbi:MAG: Fpg/Nei family DNA glycosylase [Chloroflexi bacterium]|nr:Fpg/Nei family DNA glycosylase [Chloroflexota bacterium]
MPETPDLVIIEEVLRRRVLGARVDAVEVLRPIVLRVLLPDATPEGLLAGRALVDVQRQGKFLSLALDDGGWLVANFMLAGHYRLCPPDERRLSRDYVILHLESGLDLRYHDDVGMGKLYLTRDRALVPGFSEMGRDVLDLAWTPALFVEGLRAYRGEIKGILTDGRLVAGIGNAYADEILYRAGLYPFRKRTSLTRDEQVVLFHAMRAVIDEAIVVLRARMGDDIHQKVRDFLQVHNKKGQPCPHCGQPIAEIKVAQRATNFCRRCQPGSLFRN